MEHHSRFATAALALAMILSPGCPGGDASFDLRVDLVPPPGQDPFADLDVLEMTLEYDQGTPLTFYSSPVENGEWQIDGVPPSAEAGLAVVSFRGMGLDPADVENALELANGVSVPVSVDTAQSISVYFSRRQRLGQVAGELGARRVEVGVASLPGGDALVVGGRVGSYPVDQTSPGIERMALGGDGRYQFDEVDGTYHRLGAVLHRVDRAGSPLDGLVLIIGGWEGAVEGDAMVVEADAYDPATDTVAEAFDLPIAVAHPELTRLEDGRLLLSGGLVWQGSDELPSGDYIVIDVLVGQAVIGGQMDRSRVDHRAAQLDDGAVLVCGGSRYSFSGWTSTGECEVWTPGGVDSNEGMSLAEARSDFGLQRLPYDPQGRIVAFGGCVDDPDLGPDALDSAEVYDPASRTWSALDVRMTSPRCDFGMAELADGRTLICGGEDAAGETLESCELFDPAMEAFVPLPDVSIPGGRASFGLTTLSDGKLLLVGGDGGDAQVAYLFNQ
jgi:hypothetical protein